MNWIENFWNEELKKISELTQDELERVFGDNDQEIRVSRKYDNSIVTEIDHYVSNLIKDKVVQRGGGDICFFSEEDNDGLSYPAVVVDPIDGTNQLAKGESDCCISLAILNSPDIKDPLSRAWIYNPFTGYELKSGSRVVQSRALSDGPYLGLISKSDFKRGIFKDVKLPENTILYPKGSIALKLALLGSGFCDFVFSRTPKNIWDIAAAVLLLKERGINTYTRDGILVEMDKEKFMGPLLWCREEYYPFLSILMES